MHTEACATIRADAASSAARSRTAENPDCPAVERHSGCQYSFPSSDRTMRPQPRHRAPSSRRPATGGFRQDWPPHRGVPPWPRTARRGPRRWRMGRPPRGRCPALLSAVQGGGRPQLPHSPRATARLLPAATVGERILVAMPSQLREQGGCKHRGWVRERPAGHARRAEGTPGRARPPPGPARTTGRASASL